MGCLTFLLGASLCFFGVDEMLHGLPPRGMFIFVLGFGLVLVANED